jgi:hypothetical protein
VTSCPAATSRFTARRPITPVAPATNTLIARLLSVPDNPDNTYPDSDCRGQAAE